MSSGSLATERNSCGRSALLTRRLDRDEQRALDERTQQRAELRVEQVGLDAQHDDRPDVLEDQHAQRDPARQRVELGLVVEQLHDDHRAADRAAHGEVQQRRSRRRPCGSRTAGRTRGPSATHSGNCSMPVTSTGLPADQQLLQVHLEPDHEQQQDQADLGDRLDALLVLDQAQADLRPDEHARQQVGEQQRLPQPVGDERQHRRHGDAQADAGQKVHVFCHDRLSVCETAAVAVATPRAAPKAVAPF